MLAVVSIVVALQITRKIILVEDTHFIVLNYYLIFSGIGSLRGSSIGWGPRIMKWRSLSLSPYK